MHELGLVEAVRAIRASRLDACTYRAALRDRARRLDPEIHAFTELSAAEEVSPADSQFAGVPVAIKDIIDTRDLPTRYGSPAFPDHRPAEDAWVVARLRALGAYVMGKTVTTEFAWRQPGPTRNPWNRSHTPGGSSSGSAAAVAAGLAPLALGTQTFGSVIRPAAFCGVVGLKPSYGAIPRLGVHPLAGSLDHVGLFARSVTDAAYALSLLADTDARDPHGLPLPAFEVALDAGLPPLPAARIALVRTGQWDRIDPAQRELLLDVAGRLATAGVTVTELTLPDPFAVALDAARIILAREASGIFGPLLARSPELVSAHLADLIREGEAVATPDYEAALAAQSTLRTGLAAVLEGYDAILTVPAPGPAPHGLAYTGDPGLCVPWTFLGVPCVTLPAGEDRGLPMGVQLVGAYRDDLRLLRAARRCEAVLDRPVRFPQA